MSKVGRLKIAFAAGILAMLANAVIPYQTFRWLSTAEQASEHSEAIIAAANEAFSTLKDAETGQRGFILTARDEFLQPYDEALREIRPVLVRLQSLIADRPGGHRRVEDLQRHVDGKIRHMDRVISLRRAKGLDAAARLVTEGEGKALMDEIRVIVRELTLVEGNHLVELKQVQKRRASIAVYALALVAAIDLLVLGIVYFLVFRTISERAAVESDLREMGDRLKSGMDTLAVRNREMQLFHNMTEALQSASTTEESYGLIAKFAGQLFPDNPGTIYVFHASRDVLEAVGNWGAPADHRDVFEPDDCWALRRT